MMDLINAADYKYFLDKVMTFTDDGYIIVDKNGIIVEINERYRAVFGLPREQIIGRYISKLIANSKLPDILRKRYCEQLVVDKLRKEDVGSSDDKVAQYMLVSRSHVENEAGELLGAIAQVKLGVDTVSSAKRMLDAFNELEFYREEYHQNSKNRFDFSGIVGSSDVYQKVKRLGMKAAKNNFEVLITGETGTGKEVFARAIHNASDRAKKPMVSINCAAIPANLLEAELFGYEEGAFTGAKKGGKQGKFSLANGGTLFLDEIGDMPLLMQAKILRVLQEREVEPVGGTESIPLDIRVISATRRNLQEMVEIGKFREDLYYRLNVINIDLPPLRQRQNDILELAATFLRDLNETYQQQIVFAEQVKYSLMNYQWPGNVRELENVIKSAYATCDGFMIDIGDLPAKFSVRGMEANSKDNSEKKLSTLLDIYERSVLLDVLRLNKGNCKQTAKDLGISRSVLYKKMERLQIKRMPNTEFRHVL